MRSKPALVRIADEGIVTLVKATKTASGEFLMNCPVGCGRRFGTDTIDRHIRICEKVFINRRETFDSSKYRLRRTFKK